MISIPMAILLTYLVGFVVTFILYARYDENVDASWSTLMAIFWPFVVIYEACVHTSVAWKWFWFSPVATTLEWLHRQTLQRLRKLVFVGPK